jgi:hypothetical protein
VQAEKVNTKASEVMTASHYFFMGFSIGWKEGEKLSAIKYPRRKPADKYHTAL